MSWTEFCLGLHTAVLFRMQSLNLELCDCTIKFRNYSKQVRPMCASDFSVYCTLNMAIQPIFIEVILFWPDYQARCFYIFSLGFSPMSVFIHNGARCEPASAFLKPAMSRENLHVFTGAHVTRVWLIE